MLNCDCLEVIVCVFWPTVCKMVPPMLSDHCLSCRSVCPICDVGVLSPNGWMDHDETWHGGRPRPRPHCVRWRPSSPSPKGAQPSQFLVHVSCGQMAEWIKMPLGRIVGLGPGDIVIWGPSSPSPKRRTAAPTFRPMSVVANVLDGSRCHWYGGRPWPRPHCVISGTPLSSPKGAQASQFLVHVSCGQTAG